MAKKKANPAANFLQGLLSEAPVQQAAVVFLVNPLTIRPATLHSFHHLFPDFLTNRQIQHTANGTHEPSLPYNFPILCRLQAYCA